MGYAGEDGSPGSPRWHGEGRAALTRHQLGKALSNIQVLNKLVDIMDILVDESKFHDLQQVYSVCSLVWHRMEEQITGNFASQIFKQPSKHGWEGPRSCQKYSQLLYDQFGGWLEASNHPHLFTGRLPPGY